MKAARPASKFDQGAIPMRSVRRGLAILASCWMALSASMAHARYEEPCGIRFLARSCGNPAYADTVVCLDPSTVASPEIRAGTIIRLIDFAAQSLDDRDPGWRLHGSRLAACRLFQLDAPDQAGDVILRAQMSTFETALAHGSGGAYLEPFATLMFLQAEAGFDTDLDASMTAFERIIAHYSSPLSIVGGRTLAVAGFARQGRLAIATRQFDEALALIVRFPRAEGERLGYLVGIAKAAAEGAMWESAATVLPLIDADTPILETMPDSRYKGWLREDVLALPDAIARRQWPQN